jgi:RNA polymerase sigma factor (sigma-70 family)
VGGDHSERLDAGFERFVASASPGLLRSAYLLTGDHAVAEDLLQSALLRTLRRWDSITGPPGAYAFAVLVNLSRDRLRAGRRRPATAPEHDALERPAADQLDRLVERDAITRAARRLPNAQREVLACRFVLDLTVAETADALVSTVHWTFSCVHGRRAGACPRPATATDNVLDNVAAAVVNPTRHGALGVISASWFDQAAHAVASFSSVDDQTTIRFGPRGIVLRSRLVLNTDGLGPIRFGAFLGPLERLLFPMLGRPDGGYRATLDECGIDHALTWPILLNPSTGRPERGEELTVLFHRGRFVGYRYGGYALPPDAARSYLRAATATGLVIGDTLAIGQRLYGRAFRISAAQGGTWQARTPHGTLTGYASDHPEVGDVSPSSRVASIDAGDVGCPAVSP